MLAVLVGGVQLLASARHEARAEPVQACRKESVWCQLAREPSYHTVAGDAKVGRRHGGEADRLMLLKEAGSAGIQ